MRDLLLRLRRDFPAAVLPDLVRKHLSEKKLRRASRFPADPRRSFPSIAESILDESIRFNDHTRLDRLGASRFDVPASVHLKLDGTSQFLHLPTTGYLHSQRFGSL
jgi:hypothetical protein